MPSSTLRIAEIAPPWLPVPPPGYGGTELMIDALCRGLTRAGHEVTLFTTGRSTCPVHKHWLFDQLDPRRMGAAVEEFHQAFAAYDVLAGTTDGDVDVVHDHTLAGLFFGPSRVTAPIVSTVHGPFDSLLGQLYPRVVGDVTFVAISHDQVLRVPCGVCVERVIHHGIEYDRYPYAASTGDHLVFLGRMSPDKGLDTAIRVARAAGRPLRIAAKMREPGEIDYFHDVVEPQLDADIEFVGEADFPTKVELLSSSAALLNPIRWPEPFGLVMIEAMACGTPVIGGSWGAAPEIVDEGITGFLGNDEATLLGGLLRLDELDRSTCRDTVIDRFSSDRMAADYVAVFTELLDRRARANGPRSASAA